MFARLGSLLYANPVCIAGSTLLDDASCWDRYCFEYNKSCLDYEENVLFHVVDSGKSKGPTDARSKVRVGAKRQ